MGGLNLQELVSAFIVLFAVIDIIGAIPIILDLKQKGRVVNAPQATLIAAVLLVGFFFAGDMMLKLFQVDIASFAVAGAFVIFLMSLEMLLDIEIFKSDAEAPKDSSFFPVVFPLFAGAGALTTMLSIRAQYASVNILGAILMNCLVIYIGLKITKNLEKVLGAGGIYMLKKFFGIILLAISVKLFTTNLTVIIENILHVAK